MKRYLLPGIFSLFAFVTSSAQRMSRAGLLPKEFSVQYENDLFAKTDYYYTQGVQISLNHPSLQHFVLSKLMLRLKGDVYSAGVALEGDAFSPTSILSDSILYGDRPYAASLMAHYSQESRKGKLSVLSQVTVGVVGPAAGGYELQAGIHRNTGNVIPHGWQYQIQNDAVLNYWLTLKYRLIHLRYLLVDGSSTVNAGTYLDKAGAGLDIQSGLFGNDQKRFSLVASYNATGSLVGYDATLQGGLFNRSSPYTIAASDVTRATLQQKVMLAIQYHHLKLEGSYSWLTHEFKTGRSHAWGGLGIFYIF